MQEEFACSLHMDSIINSSQDSPAEGAKCKRAPLWKVISLAKLIFFRLRSSPIQTDSLFHPIGRNI